MKIAILTQPLSNNYGGILQAYALQTVLKSMGHEPILLNRNLNYPPSAVIIARTLSACKCIVRKYILKDKNINVASPLGEYYFIDKTLAHDDSELRYFVHLNISQTKSIRSSWLLRIYTRVQHFDCFIVGSDQVWREDYSPCITDYFLGFLSRYNKVRRIAYAASFGVEHNPISSEKLELCTELAQRFDAISVREQSGKQLVRDLFHEEANLVLDPTLLLNVEHYRSLINKKDIRNSGVVNYVLDDSGDKEKIINVVLNRLNLSCTELCLFPTKGKNKEHKLASVSQWLAAFSGADFIVTDSFHGCVFSIIFEKPFVAIGNSERGISRFQTLLGSLGLENRLVLSLDDFMLRKEALLMTKPDFATAVLKSEVLVKDSLNFLRNALK